MDARTKTIDYIVRNSDSDWAAVAAAYDAGMAAERERWQRMLIAAANEAARQAAYGHGPVITVTDDGWRCNWPT